MVKYIRANSGNTMYVKIYQIDSDRDTDRLMFADWDFAQKYGWDESLYNLVWEGELPMCSLDDIYTKFGNNYEGDRPADFKGHTLSVSDVVVVDGNAKYCDSFGWQRISFDESKTL